MGVDHLCFCRFKPEPWVSSKKMDGMEVAIGAWDRALYEVWYKDKPEIVYLVEESECQNLVIGAGTCINYLGTVTDGKNP